MNFIIYTNKKTWPLKPLQKKILEFISKHEPTVLSEIDSDPFDKNVKCLNFSKNNIYFMGTAYMSKAPHDDVGNETKKHIASKLKTLNKTDDLNLAKEQLLNSKNSLRFIFTSNVSKIRADHENIIIWMTTFFKTEYDAVIVQLVQKTKTKEEFLLW